MSQLFSVQATDGLARRGLFTTALHGAFETPAFMPVGTKATVKGVDHERLKEAGAQITLVNTYHLHVRPGEALINRMGGVHRFCSWEGPILSDSGGFQVFSLKSIRSIKESGVEFRSHLDGALIVLTPERSVAIQEALGVDIAMAFDECTPGDATFDEARRSLERTLRWEQRCLDARSRPETALFGITQGAAFPELRGQSAEALRSMPFDGYAIGGLSVGEPQTVMYEVLSYHPQQLPADRVRYLMGVGTPRDIVEAVRNGVDMFDCVMPTRAGRFGRAFTTSEQPYITIRNAQWAEDPRPIDASCSCLACRRYSRSYIHHLFRVDEMLGPQLLSIHNLTHYLTLMADIRGAISRGTFDSLYQAVCRLWDGHRAQGTSSAQGKSRPSV